MMTETKPHMPLNLQFFAKSAASEPQNTAKPDDVKPEDVKPEDVKPEDVKPDVQNESPLTLDEINKIMAELANERAEKAKERVEKEKTKAELDKALKKVGELTKTVRQNMSAQEQEDEAEKERQAQHAAEFARLQEFERKTLAKERYLMQGMEVEMAGKAAEAEVAGDMDKLAEIQKQHTETLVKAKEVEWKKSRPPMNAGVESETSVTLEQFNKWGYAKRAEFKREHPEVYKKYVNGGN